MQKKGLKKAKKRFFALSFLFIGIVVLSFVSIFEDCMQIMNNRNELATLTDYYHELLQEEESLTSEVTKLHDPEYVARYARERYMYSLPGEFIIKMPNQND
ncbi:MAG: septum formation initiator family protein [Bacilli bacterium]|nr:septum formation initiator family protein [Bacilli bacterium]